MRDQHFFKCRLKKYLYDSCFLRSEQSHNFVIEKYTLYNYYGNEMHIIG